MAYWEQESRHYEFKFTSKFENILDLLFSGNGLSARTGQGTSDQQKEWL
jgi:hypothetical protein